MYAGVPIIAPVRVSCTSNIPAAGASVPVAGVAGPVDGPLSNTVSIGSETAAAL